MSRPQRIEYANAYYHVMNRGAGRRRIFNNDQERAHFLTIISDAHIQFNIGIHSYCLMPNHYHLLIKTPSSNLGRAMRHINGVYTQRYNRLNQTDGPLFRGRYKSILIDSDSYLLHLSKYIHLNLLESRMVDDLSDYKWSSILPTLEIAFLLFGFSSRKFMDNYPLLQIRRKSIDYS